MKKLLLLGMSHLLVGAGGFALGIYALPILLAPDAPDETAVATAASSAIYSGRFQRDLADSDFLHWGEGSVSVGRDFVTLQGKLAPGPDYQLYLSPAFVETEAEFERLKPEMSWIGEVRVFENFIVPVPDSIDPDDFNTVVVWCESFGEFITAAQYR